MQPKSTTGDIADEDITVLLALCEQQVLEIERLKQLLTDLIHEKPPSPRASHD